MMIGDMNAMIAANAVTRAELLKHQDFVKELRHLLAMGYAAPDLSEKIHQLLEDLEA